MSLEPERPKGGSVMRHFDIRQTRALLEAAAGGLQGVPFGRLTGPALRALRHALQCNAVAVYEVSAIDRTLTLSDRDGDAAAPAPLTAADPLLLEALAGDAVLSSRRLPDPAGATSTDLAVAMRSGSKTYGVVAATTTAAAGFGPSDRAFVESMAAIFAMTCRSERRVRLAASLFARSRAVFELNPSPMMIVDAASLQFLDVNQMAIDVYGYGREQWLGMTPFDLHPYDRAGDVHQLMEKLSERSDSGTDTRHRKADGSYLDAHLSVVVSDRDGQKIFIVTVQDMTERNEALARSQRSEESLASTQRQFEYSALHDRLTGLPNRVLLQDELNAAIESARAGGKTAAVLFIDLDEFKNVNDTMGHAEGDVLLREIGERLRGATRHSDCIARVGGDEFIAVLAEAGCPGDVEHVAAHLARIIAEPVRLTEREVVSTCSIGIALFPQDGADAQALLRNADIAMYRAKHDGRATVRFFTPAMHDERDMREDLEGRLSRALDEEAFDLLYQPIYALNGTLLGSEALIRWPQRDGSVVPPGDFIPYAEEFGMIVPIGTWVLNTACMQNAAWNRAGVCGRVNVNVSAKQIADPHFLRTVKAALADSGLPPKLLELELTETVMDENVERNAAVLQELRAAGVRVAIDDFGTGYNSLVSLRSYVVDTLKLGVCFVCDIATNAVDRAIATAVIAAAHSLGARVVAEGIETEDQRAVLAELQCDFGQGYLFSKPLSVEEFGRLLDAARALAA